MESLDGVSAAFSSYQPLQASSHNEEEGDDGEGDGGDGDDDGDDGDDGDGIDESVASQCLPSSLPPHPVSVISQVEASN